MAGADPQVIRELVDRIRRAADPSRIYLFGSRSRGDADDRSDYDLLIVLDRSAGAIRGLSDRVGWFARLESTLRGLPVGRDLIILSQEEFDTLASTPGTMKHLVATEGRLLYERAA